MAALQDYVESMRNLALIYYRGEETSRNIPEAIRWWEKAANLGAKGAQHNLGLMYFLGKGVE